MMIITKIKIKYNTCIPIASTVQQCVDSRPTWRLVVSSSCGTSDVDTWERGTLPVGTSGACVESLGGEEISGFIAGTKCVGACVRGPWHCGWGADFCGFLKCFTFGTTTYSWQQY